MKIDDYDKLQELEGKATEKLIKYINKQDEIKYILEKMMSKYPFLQEESAKLPFNIWLCCDYKDKNGFTFVEKLIQEDPSLSKKDIEILREKAASYVSLFQIDSFQEPYVYVTDILTKEEHMLLEPQVSYVLKEGDYLLSRLGTVLGRNRMIGEVSFVPKSIIHSFIRILLKDFNKLPPEERAKGTKAYLKEDALSIYDLFYHSAYKYFDPQAEDLIPIYQELDDFEEYLNTKKNSLEIEKHLSNMIELYEYYFTEEGLSFKDLDKVNLKDILNDAIYDKFITSGLAFNSYLNTLKTYLGYRVKISKDYQNAHNEIVQISRERFKYLKKILDNNTLAQGDPLLSLKMRDYDSDSINGFINDFDRFILYIFDYPLQLTDKKQFIKKNDQDNIVDVLEKDYELFFRPPRQMKSPALHFFFHMALRLKILKIKKNHLSVTENASEYLSMSREDKYTLLLKGFWNQDTIKELLQIDSRNARQAKKLLLQTIKKIEVGPIARQNLPISENISEDNIYLMIRYMSFMGILSNESYKGLIVLTSTGKIVATHLNEWSKPRKSKVIYMGQHTKANKEDNYGESKTGGFDEV